MLSSSIRRVAPVSMFAVAVLLAACSDRSADRRAAADSDLARDLALVQSAGAVEPIFRDTALNATQARTNAPAPVAVGQPTPRSTPRRDVAARQPRPRQTGRPAPQRDARRPTRVAEIPPPEPEQPAARPAQTAEPSGASGRGSIGAGAILAARSNARVCTRTNLPGDRITATVNEPVRGSNGAEIPAGAKVVLEVASIDGAESGEQGQVAFRVTSVAIGDESYPASGRATATGPLERAAGPRNAASDRRKVIGGAIAGAILGQMMGKDTRSTVIGAAAGAAVGTAAAKTGEKGESCLAAGTPLRITLDDAVVMR